VGPSRSTKRLDSIKNLKDKLPAGKMRTWRRVKMAGIRYPQMSQKSVPTDSFLM
jgi:hypothetical protein